MKTLTILTELDAASIRVALRLAISQTTDQYMQAQFEDALSKMSPVMDLRSPHLNGTFRVQRMPRPRKVAA
jgi:hypothetical protein